MKRILQTGFLPLLALTVALGLPSAAHAKRKKPAAPAAPSASAVKFEHDVPPIFVLSDSAREKNKEDAAKFKCVDLPKQNGKTAWDRGFEQATSGQRAKRKVQIGIEVMPPLQPCHEYIAVSGQELACCVTAFKKGLKALGNYMSQCGAMRPTKPDAIQCYSDYEVGAEAARRMCAAPTSCPSMDDLKLKTQYPGCMALGFNQKKSRCDSERSRNPASVSQYAGALHDRRADKSKEDLMVLFKLHGSSSSAGDAGSNFGHNHAPGAGHDENCTPEQSGWSTIESE